MFKTGDRVVYVGMPGGKRGLGDKIVEKGETGTVFHLENEYVGVRWDKRREQMHDLTQDQNEGPTCTSGHGWWVLLLEIKKATGCQGWDAEEI